MSTPTLSVTVHSVSTAHESTSPAVLRSSKSISGASEDAALDVVDSLDELFATSGRWHQDLLTRIRNAATDGEVTYIVPGHPLLGDDSVQLLIELDAMGEIDLTIVEPELGEVLSGILLSSPSPISFIDWATISDQLSEHPFSGGRIPLTSFQTSIVTNLNVPESQDSFGHVLARIVGLNVEVDIISMSGRGERTSFRVKDLAGEVPDGSYYAVIRSAEDDEYYRTSNDLQRLVARLRAPGGCPWDREQTHQTLIRNLIEETYELAEALEAGDSAHVREELGDFILQAYLHAQIAEEAGSFTIEDVFGNLIEKLVRRHPHVFEATAAEDSEQVVRNWETIKRLEREDSGSEADNQALGNLPASLPALMRAQTVMRRAFRGGFTPHGVAFHRERALSQVADSGADRDALEALLDLIVDSTAKDIDLEQLLRTWSQQFQRSFDSDVPTGNSN